MSSNPPPPPIPPRSPFGAPYQPPRPPDNHPPRILGELELEREPGTLAVHDQAFIFAERGTPIVAPPRPVAEAAASPHSRLAAALRNRIRNRNTIDSPPPARGSSKLPRSHPHSNNNNESASPSDDDSSKIASPVQSPEQGQGNAEGGDRHEPMEDVAVAGPTATEICVEQRSKAHDLPKRCQRKSATKNAFIRRRASCLEIRSSMTRTSNDQDEIGWTSVEIPHGHGKGVPVGS